MACVLKTYSRALRAYVLTCQRALRAYVLMCQRALRALVPKCQRTLSIYVPHVSTCLACLCTHVTTCLASSSAQVPTCIYSIAWHGLHDHVITCQHPSFDALFSVSLPLLPKLYTLLARFKSLISVFLSNGIHI